MEKKEEASILSHWAGKSSDGDGNIGETLNLQIGLFADDTDRRLKVNE